MNLKSLLSKEEAISLLEVVQETLSCEDEEQLRRIFQKLNPLVPHDFAICALAKADKRGYVTSFDIANISYPEEWLSLYFTREYLCIDPIVKENYRHFNCQSWAQTYAKYKPPREFVSNAQDFGLYTGYTSGLKNSRGDEGSLLSFAGRSMTCHSKTESMLNYLTPHLHQALLRIFSKKKGQKNFNLTPREKEVLQWVKEGKSTWDISVIFGISARTVNYHINNIKRKVDAVNRTQAVAIVVEQGLIDL